MPLIRGLFKVVSIEKYLGTESAFVKLETTQVSSEVFAARIEIMVTDPNVMNALSRGVEVCVDITTTVKRDIAQPPALR